MNVHEQDRSNRILKDGMYVIIVAIIFAIVGYIILNEIIFPYKIDESLIVNYDLSKDIIPEPIQESIEDEEEVIVRTLRSKICYKKNSKI